MNVDIAERLAKRRREAGYSQEGLAEKLGVSRQAVSKWERSESSPDTDNLIALAQLYGVSLDDLLYVDESFKDDVEFEAADRAADRKEGSKNADTAEKSGASDSTDSVFEVEDGDAKVKFGPGGLHVKDGDDYVHLSWKDGINVKEKGGDEVHVGWDGIHVKEKGFKDGESCGSAFNEAGDEGEWVKAKVIVNGKPYDSWEDYKDICSKRKAWVKFPFPLLVLLVYILLGVFANAWAVGLFVFFLIPIYYMIVHAVGKKQPGNFFKGIYPLVCVIWFLWMAFVLNQAHPAWVIFLTIPLAEWLFHTISKAYNHRKA